MATFIGNLNIENANNNYSISNEINFDFTNKNDKFLMYRQFVGWYTKGYSVAPLSEYSNNDVCHELPRLDDIYDKKKQ